jgi:hypothetical protein
MSRGNEFTETGRLSNTRSVGRHCAYELRLNHIESFSGVKGTAIAEYSPLRSPTTTEDVCPTS